MKLCIQCRHCKVPYKYHTGELGGWKEYHYGRAMCAATPDLVTARGNNHRRCADERADQDGCGPDARNYEARPEPPVAPLRKGRAGFLAWLSGGANA